MKSLRVIQEKKKERFFVPESNDWHKTKEELEEVMEAREAGITYSNLGHSYFLHEG
jgi:hypothetical protein